MIPELRAGVLHQANATATVANTKHLGTSVKLSVVAGLFALAIAIQASAGCGGAAPANAKAAPTSGSPFDATSGRLFSAVYRPGGRLVAVSTLVRDDDDWNASIVGLWKFEVRASMDEGPFRKGDLIDWGLATWHDDGTEIQFSAGRPYDAGDVCMGVWKQTGHSKYHLNHIALGKDLATGATFDGLTNIRADVTVDHSGNSFTGTYQIIQYTGNPTDGTEFDQSTIQYQFAGTVVAKRVEAD
jgi:hypothetical protein